MSDNIIFDHFYRFQLASVESDRPVFLNLLGFKSRLTTKFLYYCPGHQFFSPSNECFKQFYNYKILRRCKLWYSNHFYWRVDILLMLNLVNNKVSKMVQVPARRPPSPVKHWDRPMFLCCSSKICFPTQSIKELHVLPEFHINNSLSLLNSTIKKS